MPFQDFQGCLVVFTSLQVIKFKLKNNPPLKHGIVFYNQTDLSLGLLERLFLLFFFLFFCFFCFFFCLSLLQFKLRHVHHTSLPYLLYSILCVILCSFSSPTGKWYAKHVAKEVFKYNQTLNYLLEKILFPAVTVILKLFFVFAWATY